MDLNECLKLTSCLISENIHKGCQAEYSSKMKQTIGFTLKVNFLGKEGIGALYFEEVKGRNLNN